VDWSLFGRLWTGPYLEDIVVGTDGSRLVVPEPSVSTNCSGVKNHPPTIIGCAVRCGWNAHAVRVQGKTRLIDAVPVHLTAGSLLHSSLRVILVLGVHQLC
jgi:hypothetical protein